MKHVKLRIPLTPEQVKMVTTELEPKVYQSQLVARTEPDGTLSYSVEMYEEV